MKKTRTGRVVPVAVAIAAVSSLAAGAGALWRGQDQAPSPEPSWGPAPGALSEPPASPSPEALRAAQDKPNVLLITTDDMMIGDLAFMPHTRRLLARQGVNLTEGIAPTPICVPARASLLTGQYTHNHGAHTIEGPQGGFASFNDRNTLPVWLRAGGYRTVFAGKYLNSYGVKNPRYIPPGWDHWYGSVDMTTYAFYGTRYNENGTVVKHSAHNSDVLADYTTNEIERSARGKRPWFMWVNYVAPHHGGGKESDDPDSFGTTRPADRHRNRFRNQTLPKGPEMFIRGQGPYGKGRLSPALRRDIRELYQQRLESLLSVDEAVRDSVRALRRTRQLDDTYIIFTSDNGFLTGHHNSVGKLVPFNQSLRIPIVARGPGIPRGRISRTPTTNPDLAVTIAAIAGVKPGRKVDGVPMLRYWKTRRTFQRPIPLVAYPVADGRRPMYTGLREGRGPTYGPSGAARCSTTGIWTRVNSRIWPGDRATVTSSAGSGG